MPPDIDVISKRIIGAAIRVHRTLGPGLLEKTYLRCLAHELTLAGHTVELQKSLPVVYKGITVSDAYHIDLLVDGLVIIELKAVAAVNDIHRAQLLTYLKLSNKPLGLLLNFNGRRLSDGIIRVINTP